jgi:hypothetical protein
VSKLTLEWDDGKIEEVEAFSIEEMKKGEKALLAFGKKLGIFSEDFTPPGHEEVE